MTSKTSDFARYNRASQVGAPLISRKDTIIIAMLVNIALLVVLFATASKRHEVAVAAKAAEIAQGSITDAMPNKTMSKSASQNIAQTVVKPASKLPVDEIDELLAKLATSDVVPAKVAQGSVKHPAKSSTSTTQAVKQESSPEYYVIKSGDNPWTIARKFHIKFEDLLRLNNLDEEKAKNLKIGQKLRIR